MHYMATSVKKSSPRKKQSTVSKKTSPKKKVAPKKAVKKSTVPVSQKVDYYPNRMTVAVAALAGTLLILISLIAVLGVQ